MPLSFQSLSHGTIAFGFFNIESDMLLLDRYFFFATEFCDLVGNLAAQKETDGPKSLNWKIWEIKDPADIGDLMGAIHGVHYSGFIGDVYRRYPFPEKPEEFKQNPSGATTQTEVAKLINPYAIETAIAVIAESDGLEIAIGNYRFLRPEFQRLLDYVWLGGYPRWNNDLRPGYVVDMQERALSSANPLIEGMNFSL